MLPPKRSTRSAHMISEAEEDTQSQLHDIQQMNLVVFKSSSPQPAETWNDQAHFVFNTPQVAGLHQDMQADSAQRKARRKLTASQRLALEDLAGQGNHPSLDARRALAVEIGLELKVISVWFQNKRRPTNKIHERTPADACQDQESEKADQGTRLILGDVNANTIAFSETALDKASNSFAAFPSASLSSKSIPEQGKTLPGLWDFLPSSSPGPASEACHSETPLLVDKGLPSSVTKGDKRRSLEWACKNDERTTKRARTSLDLELPERSSAPPTSRGNALQRRRQRTDKNPRRPSPNISNRTASVSRPGSQLHGSLAHSGSFSGCTCLEKDILDVALALIQLKGKGTPRLARKSI